ncbi:SDR family oxidoreductase [Ramlibacter albus]|uniref:SDR family oxidoreductase n=1 Tax=Ramlibacter albus TaxID=2079448 RepID=A0A923MBX6_9BURK|nr:SDR family oxidoreductase [Ramlibacter albus]MBC5767835.1 SDR family oxidoreductase [Ramlibacter albus]
MDLGIKGKWALVCGASKGLGFGCAHALAREGANVVIVARTAQALQEAADRIRKDAPGVEVIAVPADITTVDGRNAVFGKRRDFDIVVTNAGGPPPGDFHDWNREDWVKAIDANMLTPIELIKATIDGMAERGFGRIVNITSGAVKAPISTLGLSNGARSGLTGFVAGVARTPSLVSRNVTINNLLPGAFDTDRLRGTMTGAAKKSGKSIDEVMEARRVQIPAQRFGTSDEFGATCAFLCSAQAGYITGQNVLTDGGAYPGTY